MKVLVVVDDMVVRRHIEAALGRGGFAVIGVGDGIAAWEILKRADTPRLLVIEWAMDGLSAPELLERLRGTAGRASSYVVVTSVRAKPEDAVAALDAGADDYMVKPVHSAELRARVQAGSRIIEREMELERRAAGAGEAAA